MASDFSIGDMLAWARTKPAGEEYDFCRPSHCAVAQFGLATGRRHLVGLKSSELERLGGWSFVMALVFGGTFGALVERLEALCPETIVTPSEWTKLDAYLTESVEA